MTQIVLEAGVFCRWHVRGSHDFETEAIVRLGELTYCVGGFETANMHETAPADPVLVAQVAESVIHYSGIRKGHSYPRGIGRERARSERRRSKVHVDGASVPKVPAQRCLR